MSIHQQRLERARLSLRGLAIGDSFGERFFLEPGLAVQMIEARAEPRPPWRYTDDTAMALSIVAELAERETLDAERLARAFLERYGAEPGRGYGPGMHDLMASWTDGAPLADTAAALFDGSGSYGNGAAMRVAPLGAYYADDLDATYDAAVCSAQVTHTHPEGVAGAIAVALGAAIIARSRASAARLEPAALLTAVVDRLPQSAVRETTALLIDVAHDVGAPAVASRVGSGARVSAQDTVPFTLWCAAHHLDDFEQAMWATVSGLGDRDTTCAIVGGLVALHVGAEGLPARWLAAAEQPTF